MSSSLMLLILLGAALHAGWNSIVKSSADKSSDIVLVASAASVIAAVTLPFLPLPQPRSLPFLAGSVTIHMLYFWLVGLAYRHGDLSYAYPLMRGTAPLITALVATVAISETLHPSAYAGIMLLSAGVLVLCVDGGRAGRAHVSTTAFGLANAFVVAAYTFVDGLGVRLSGNAFAYTQWLFFLNALPLLAFSLTKRREALSVAARMRWKTSIVGGACTIGSYGLALWAMTKAPLALVGALRETAVVFGAVFAAVFLRERFGWLRWLAVGLVSVGAIAMKL